MRPTTLGLRAGTALCAFVATAAYAQPESNLPPPDVRNAQASTSTEQSPQGEIVVTGSRIRRNPLDLDAPRIFVDDQDIKKTGLSAIGDVLQRLPSSGGGLNGRNNNSGNVGSPPDGSGVGAGSSEVDLRFLGSRRVLVLVDGLRYVNGASASGVPGSTDLNSIPASMIDRVEVLQDGASAIYGSDAIAGVINIITKRRQAGFDASVQLGKYLDEGDGFSQNYQLSWGNGTSGPTQIVIGGNFVKSNGVLAGDRAISAFPGPYATDCVTGGGCSRYILNGRFDILQDPTKPFNAVTNPFVQLTLNKPITGTAPVYPTDFKDFTDADRFNYAPFNFLEIPVTRYGAFANLTQEISPAVNFHLKGVWNRRQSRNQAGPLPFGVGAGIGAGTRSDTIVISATNPYNPFGVDLVSGAGGNFDAIYRRLVEIGLRRYKQTVNTTYGVATLEGHFPLIAGDWFWDVNASYGSNKARQTFLGNVNGEKLAQALGPIDQCTDSCVPFDIFGTPGSITQDMLNFVAFTEHDRSKQTQFDVTGNLSGHLAELPGGPLGLAMGLEYRKLKGSYDPDPVVAAGFGNDIPSLPAKGSYSVKEAYAELNAPLLKDLPFANLLELNGAVRFSDYSTSGSTTTFKAGANWKPVPALRLRASWAQGFRAPSIGELFGGLSRFDSAIDDPCSKNSKLARNILNDAAVATNCAAQGVPAGGSNTSSTDQLSVVTGGNPDLKPETSKSWVVGGVFSPDFIPRFSIEANWYDIRIKGAIQSVNAATTLKRCVYQNDALACANISRSASSGNVTSIQGLLENIAAIKTKGIDVNLAYRTAMTSWGRLGFTWNNTFLRKFDIFSPTEDGIAVEHRGGAEIGSPAAGYPKWKSLGVIDWDYAQWGASITGRYISGLKEINNDPVTRMKSIFYTDVQLRWAPSFWSLKNLSLAVGVNNLFNAHTPGCITCDINNIDTTLYDTPGRYYYARIGVKY